MASQKELDTCYIEHLQNTFQYNQEDGKVYWKRTYLVGKEAGSVLKNRAGNSYRIITHTFNGKQTKTMAHRLIWLLLYKEAPKEIDHLDGDGLNNKLSNLREVSRSENNKNHRKQSNNTSGVTGVSFRKRYQDWGVYSFESTPKRRQIHLGVFDNLFEACCIRKAYELKNGFTERHGL